MQKMEKGGLALMSIFLMAYLTIGLLSFLKSESIKSEINKEMRVFMVEYETVEIIISGFSESLLLYEKHLPDVPAYQLGVNNQVTYWSEYKELMESTDGYKEYIRIKNSIRKNVVSYKLCILFSFLSILRILMLIHHLRIPNGKNKEINQLILLFH